MKHAMQYYNLQDNPCRKAGAIGKSKGEPKDFWMQEEFNAFLETVSDKPETRMAFLLLYWTGMRIGELLALTYNDINLEEKTISINKSYQRLKGKKGYDHATENSEEYPCDYNAGLSCRGIPGVLQSSVWNYEKGKTFSVYQIAYGTLYGYSCSLQYAFNKV